MEFLVSRAEIVAIFKQKSITKIFAKEFNFDIIIEQLYNKQVEVIDE